MTVAYGTTLDGVNGDMLTGFFVGWPNPQSAATHLRILQRSDAVLVRRMVDRLDGLYMIDLVCDEDVQPFYDRFGFRRATGMCVRNYGCQSGTAAPVLG